MARKDDPVFNVKFVQLVESQPCLWNYTHPGYSKKEEVQKAWQHVANEIKDTVRNCRERWRTIRSSFLRSLKLARTQTGRGKRKYYLSKYLQFLIPYTKSRSCHKQLVMGGSSVCSPGMVLRKPSTSTAASNFLTRIGHMRLLEEEEDDELVEPRNGHAENDTKDCEGERVEVGNETASQPLDVQVSEEEEEPPPPALPTTCLPLRLQAIKVEQHQPPADKIVAHQSLVTLPIHMATALGNQMDWKDIAEWLKCGSSQNRSPKISTPPPAATARPAPAPAPIVPTTVTAASCSSGVVVPPDADYSFLISLHPYLKEMNGKQNRRFRQKVVGLIDNVLDNVDV